MSDRGTREPFNNQLEVGLKKYLSFERPEPALQLVEQKKTKTGDKSGGRKPSATTSNKEDVTMNLQGQTSAVGRDVSGNLEGHSLTPAQITNLLQANAENQRLIGEAYNRLDQKVTDLRNPISTTNLAKYALGAGTAVALGGIVTWVVSLFKGPADMVPTKPMPGK